jgi:hypothetical protein
LRLAFYSRDLMHRLVREQSIDFDYVPERQARGAHAEGVVRVGACA